MRFRSLLWTATLWCGWAWGAPNTLSVSPSVDAGVNEVPLAIGATVGSGVVNNPIFVDYDTNTNTLFADLTNASASTLRSLSNNATVNHQPYFVAVYPFRSSIQSIDQVNYSVLLAASASSTQPGPMPGQITASVQLPASAILSTSPNSHDGQTGWGTDLAFSVSYLGLNTTSDSGDSGIMGGLVAALSFNHSSFNAFDIHGALRQTASNWATGYDHTNYGFGFVSYSAANAISSTGSIFLQTPDVQIQNFGYYAQLTIYAFRTTRRAHEVVYSCTAGYSWPVKNEYSITDVTGGCGTLLYTSNGTDVAPTFTFAPLASGTVTFVAFTTDGSGNYSRVDNFVPQSASFSVGATCVR